MIYLQLYKCSARVIINKLTDTKTFLHVSHSMYVTPVAIVVTWSSREICLVSDKRRVTFRSISKVHLTQLGSLRFYSVHQKMNAVLTFMYWIGGKKWKNWIFFPSRFFNCKEKSLEYIVSIWISLHVVFFKFVNRIPL